MHKQIYLSEFVQKPRQLARQVGGLHVLDDFSLQMASCAIVWTLGMTIRFGNLDFVVDS
jgi:hypothetical protein